MCADFLNKQRVETANAHSISGDAHIRRRARALQHAYAHISATAQRACQDAPSRRSLVEGDRRSAISRWLTCLTERRVQAARASSASLIGDNERAMRASSSLLCEGQRAAMAAMNATLAAKSVAHACASWLSMFACRLAYLSSAERPSGATILKQRLMYDGDGAIKRQKRRYSNALSANTRAHRQTNKLHLVAKRTSYSAGRFAVFCDQ